MWAAPGRPGEPAPAGDYHRGRPAAGKQRRYLALARRVVQHHQDLPAGEQVAVHLRALVEALGYLRARHAERPQETLEHLHRADRMRGPAVQVGEKLTVGEMAGHAVRCVHRDAGLAHPALARDHHHRDGEPCSLPAAGSAADGSGSISARPGR